MRHTTVVHLEEVVFHLELGVFPNFADVSQIEDQALLVLEK
jgi:hypothetical protein